MPFYHADAEADVGLVLHGEVDEEIFAHAVDVVQAHYHAVHLRRHVAVFGRR